MALKRSPLRRKAPLRARTALRRGGWLRRLTPLRPVNPERKARLLGDAFGPQSALCRTLPCVVCAAPPPSDPHHVTTRGARGKDDATLPLCRRCHDELHRLGRLTFQRLHAIDLASAAREMGALVEMTGGGE